jgi:hypothetical protein
VARGLAGACLAVACLAVACLAVACLAVACLAVAVPLHAQADTAGTRQRGDSARRADSLAAARPGLPALPRFALRTQPPITPRRAFLLSLAVPGLAQSRLDRGSAGALFASVEAGALTMVRRSLRDVQEVRRFRVDSLPVEFVVRQDGALQPTGGRLPDRYSQTLERQRRLQVEDWLAVVAFNHLIAAADAFVSAQLWDVPLDVTAHPAPRGAWFIASWRW